MSGVLFLPVCEIIPELDSKGNPKEHRPQSRYNNISNRPLHEYGNGPFCKFKVPNCYNQPGVYLVLVDDTPKYVGECEHLGKRWSMGYGNISPRKCYMKGQSTNCRVNNLILQAYKTGNRIRLLFHETDNRFEVERKLIADINPEWNISFGRKPKTSKHQHQQRTGAIRGKYKKLSEYLDNSLNQIETLTYHSIEKILEQKLPDSAYRYKEWWSNSGHPHAKTWSIAGWKVSSVELGRSITFRRTLDKK